MNSDTSWYAAGKAAFIKQPALSGEQSGRPPDVEMKEKKPDIKELIEDVCLVDDEDDPEEAINYFRDMTRKRILLPLTGVEIQEEFKFLEAIKQFKMILEKKIEVLTLRKNLKEILYKYLSFFGSNYGRIAILYKEQYWEVMEDVLVVYCDVVMEFFQDQIRIDKKPKVEQEARRIKILLRDCLLKKMDRILHVLLKVKLDPEMEQCKRLWSDVYLYFLTKVPCQLTDDDILRSFIAFQKFKTIRKQQEGSMIDQLMLKVYKKNSMDELKKVPGLAEILDKRKKDRFYTVRDMLSHYMRHFKEKKSKECEIELLCDEDETINKHFVKSSRRFDFADPSSDSSPSTSYGVAGRRGKRKNLLELDDDSDVISALDRYDNEFSVLNGDVIKREDRTASPLVVVLDDEDDDDIIIVSDNLRAVITIDDDDDDDPPLGDALSPDKLIRPPELPAPTPMEDTTANRVEAAPTPLEDTSANRTDAVPTPLDDTLANPIKADPTTLADSSANRIEANPTPMEDTTANRVEAAPTPLEETSANRIGAVSTPLDDTLANPIKADPTTLEDSSADRIKVTPTPLEDTSANRIGAVPTPLDDTLANPIKADPTTLEDSSANRIEANPTPLDDISTSRIDAVPTPLKDSSNNRIDATPTPLDNISAIRIKAASTLMDDTSANRIKATPTPLEDSLANRIETTPTPLDDTSTNRIKSAPTPLEATSAIPVETVPTPMEATPTNQDQEIKSPPGEMDVDHSDEPSKSSMAPRVNSFLPAAAKTSDVPKPKVFRQVTQINNSLKITFKLPHSTEKNRPEEEVPKNLSEVPPASMADTNIVSESAISTEKDPRSSGLMGEAVSPGEFPRIPLEEIATSEEPMEETVSSKECQIDSVSSPNLKVSVPLQQLEKLNLKPVETTSLSRLEPVVDESAPFKETEPISSDTTSAVPEPVHNLKESSRDSIASDVPPPQESRQDHPPMRTQDQELDQSDDNDSFGDNVDDCSMDIDFEISDIAVNSTMNKEEEDGSLVKDGKVKKLEDNNNLFNRPAGVLPSSKIPVNLDDSSSISSPSYESFDQSEAETHFGAKKLEITISSSCSSDMDCAVLNSTSSSEDISDTTVESATSIDPATLSEVNSELTSKDPVETAPENGQTSIPDGDSGNDNSKDTNAVSKLTEFINDFTNNLAEEDILVPPPPTLIVEDLTSSGEHPSSEIINVICRPIEPLPKEEEITATSGTEAEAITFATADEVVGAPFGEGLAYFVHYPANSQEESQRFIVCDAPLGGEDASLNNMEEASKNQTFIHPRSGSVNETPSLSGSQPYTPQSSPNTGIETLKQEFGNLGEGSSTVYLYLDDAGTGQVAKVPVEQPLGVKSTVVEDSTRKQEESAEKVVEKTSTPAEVETNKIQTPKTTVEDFRDDLSQSVTSARKITPQEVDKMAQLPFKYSQPVWNENSDQKTTAEVSPQKQQEEQLSRPKTTQQGKRRMSQEVSLSPPARPVKIYSKDPRSGAKDLSQPRDRDMSLKAYKSLIKGTPMCRTSLLQEENTVPKTSGEDLLLFDNAIEDVPIGKPKQNDLVDNFLWSSDNEEDCPNGVINVKPDSQLYRAQDAEGLKDISVSAGAGASEQKEAPAGRAGAAVAKRKVKFSSKEPQVKEIPSVKKVVPASKWTGQIDKILLESSNGVSSDSDDDDDDDYYRRRIQQRRYQEMKEKQEQSLQRAQICGQIYSDKFEPKKKSANSKVSSKVDYHPHPVVPLSKGKDSGSVHVYHKNGQRVNQKRKNRDETSEAISRKKIAVRTDLMEKIPKISPPNGKIITPKGILKPVKECAPSSSKVVAAAERNGIDVHVAPSSPPVRTTKSGRVCKKPRSAYYDSPGEARATRSRVKAGGGNKL